MTKWNPFYETVFTLGISLLLLPKLSLQQQCDSLDDRGATECVLLDLYNSHQWATCLSEDYIIEASDGDHICRNRVTQCWYQCMMEMYDAEGGSVNSDCGCSPGEMLPNDTGRLQPQCYSPPGDTCDWYANCLEVRYPCRGTDDGYAIEFAEKFCNLYSDNYNDFTPIGRNWINAVRKCLQVALVPSLRLWVSYSCAEIRAEAFGSHSSCYTDVSPSMCELGCADIIQAFVIVNFPDGDFTEGALVSAPLATIDQMLSVMLECYTNTDLSGCIKNLLTTIEIVLRINRRIPVIGTATTAFRVARHFAKALYWVENGIHWFPLFNDHDNVDDSGDRNKRQSDDKEINVRILLVDVKLLNISNGTMSASNSEQTIDEAIDGLVSAVMNGSLSTIPLNINNTEVITSLSLINQCMDVSCNSTSNVTKLVTSPSEPATSPSESSTTPTVPSKTPSPSESSTTPTIPSKTPSASESSTTLTAPSKTLSPSESSTTPTVPSKTPSPSESSTTPTVSSKTPDNGAVQVEKQLCIYVVGLSVLALLLC